jgi:hypothetical protein
MRRVAEDAAALFNHGCCADCDGLLFVKLIFSLVKMVSFLSTMADAGALIDACADGALETTQALFLHTPDGGQSLDAACLNGHEHVVRWLVPHFAHAPAILNSGLYYAAENGHMAICDFLLTCPGIDLYHCIAGACAGGSLNVLTHIAETQSVPTAFYETGLITGCAYAHLNVVELMRELHGAMSVEDLNAGISAIDMLLGDDGPYDQIASTLFKHGATYYSTRLPVSFQILAIRNGADMFEIEPYELPALVAAGIEWSTFEQNMSRLNHITRQRVVAHVALRRCHAAAIDTIGVDDLSESIWEFLGTI